jgi:hypothetical protein
MTLDSGSSTAEFDKFPFGSDDVFGSAVGIVADPACASGEVG